ncbi:hypothetical protein ACOME3_005422 [Neoechinorhynchus agilis]
MEIVGSKTFNALESTAITSQTPGGQWNFLLTKLTELTGANCSRIFEAVDKIKGYITMLKNDPESIVSLSIYGSQPVPDEYKSDLYELLRKSGRSQFTDPGSRHLFRFYIALFSNPDGLEGYADYLMDNYDDDVGTNEITLNLWLLRESAPRSRLAKAIDNIFPFDDDIIKQYFLTNEPTINDLLTPKLISRIRSQADNIAEVFLD